MPRWVSAISFRTPIKTDLLHGTCISQKLKKTTIDTTRIYYFLSIKREKCQFRSKKTSLFWFQIEIFASLRTFDPWDRCLSSLAWRRWDGIEREDIGEENKSKMNENLYGGGEEDREWGETPTEERNSISRRFLLAFLPWFSLMKWSLIPTWRETKTNRRFFQNFSQIQASSGNVRLLQ